MPSALKKPRQEPPPETREQAYARYMGVIDQGAPPQPNQGVRILWFDRDEPRIGHMVARYGPTVVVHDLTGARREIAANYWIAEPEFAQDNVRVVTGHLKNNAREPVDVTDKNVDHILRRYPALNWLYHQSQEYMYRHRETADQYRPLDRKIRRVGTLVPREIGNTRTRNPDHAARHTWLNWLYRRMANHTLPEHIRDVVTKEYHRC